MGSPTEPRSPIQAGDSEASTEVERTFAFADLAGFTALTEAHGSATAAEIAGRFADMATESLAGATDLVKTIGDAVLLAGTDPADITKTILALWAQLEQSAGFPAASAGLHLGSAVERDGDFFGTGVNLAARLADFAHVGQIIASGEVADAAAALGVVEVVPLGLARLRNVSEAVDVFELVRADRESCGQRLSVDPVCHMRVSPTGAGAWLREGEHGLYFCSHECAKRYLGAPDLYQRSADGPPPQ